MAASLTAESKRKEQHQQQKRSKAETWARKIEMPFRIGRIHIIREKLTGWRTIYVFSSYLRYQSRDSYFEETSSQALSFSEISVKK